MKVEVWLLVPQYTSVNLCIPVHWSEHWEEKEMVQASCAGGKWTSSFSHIPVAPTEHRDIWQQENIDDHYPRSLLPVLGLFLKLSSSGICLCCRGCGIGLFSPLDHVLTLWLCGFDWDCLRLQRNSIKHAREDHEEKHIINDMVSLFSSSCKIWPDVEKAERQLVCRSAETPDAATAARPPTAAWRGRAADSNLQHLSQWADGTSRRPQQLHRRAHPWGEQGRLSRQQLLPGHTAFPGPVRSWYQWNQTRTNMWLHTSIRLLSLLFFHQWRDFPNCVHGRIR